MEVSGVPSWGGGANRRRDGAGSVREGVGDGGRSRGAIWRARRRIGGGSRRRSSIP